MKPIPFLSDKQRALFWSKVARAGEEECWLWRGKPDSNGYGAFGMGGKVYRAHRVSVRVAGYSVPTNALIDHVCRNRMCVNPAHLRTVDARTNVFENSEAVAALNAAKTHCPQGHPYSGDNLVVKRGRRECRECRREYQQKRRANLAPTGFDQARVGEQ